MNEPAIRIKSKLPYIELRRVPATVLMIIYAACFFAFAVWVVSESGYMNLPPEVGDGQAYDNIAYNLAVGNGFGHDWSDEAWREPYLKSNNDGYYDWVLEHQGPYYPTAFRPPLFPAILSGIYSIGGRKFSTWRYVNIGITVTVATLSAAFAYALAGAIPALIAAALAFFDTSFLFYVHRYMTEPLAALLILILVWTLLRYAASPERLYALLAGTVFGLMLLLRNIFLIWLPLILLLLWVLSGRVNSIPDRCWRLFAFLAPALILSVPWYARNCLVTGEFMPTGTQGTRVLAVGYSDAMFDTGGKWTFKTEMKILSSFDSAPIGGIQGEVMMAKEGKQRTVDWISKNYSRLPQLVALKITSLWWVDAQGYQHFLILLGLIGLFVVFGSSAFLVLGGLLVANTIAIALTWNVPHGRFLIPIHPILYFLAACAVYKLYLPLAAVGSKLVGKQAGAAS